MKMYLKAVVLGLLLIPVFSVVFAQQWQYQIKKGDSLWSIADEYLISNDYVKRLQQFNSIEDPYKLKPGSVISAPVEWLGNLPGSASVISTSGDVISIRKNKSSKISAGYKLEPEDKIITDDNGVAVIEFSDQSTLNIFSNTEMSFKKFKQSFDGSIVKAKISIEAGRLKVNTNPEKKKGHRLEIDSPAAITAVRGTQFRIGVQKGNGDTVTEVLSGNVAVSALDKKVSLGKLYGTKTETGKTPIKPVKLLQAPELIVKDKIENKLGKVAWKSVDRAQTYRVRVATDMDLNEIVYDELASSTEVNDIFFPQDGDFYTSVRAIDSNAIEGLDGTAKISVNARPAPPLIIGPQDETSSFNVHPDFTWTIPADNTFQLQYQLSNNEQFESVLLDQIIESTDSFTPQAAFVPGDYYWRVAYIDENGRGPFSKSSKLSVIEQPELTPEIQEAGSLVSLSLTQDPSVSRYHLQVSKDIQFNQILHEEWVDGDEFSFNTNGAGSYYIRLGIESSKSSNEVRYGDAQKIIVPFTGWKQLMISLATGLLIIL